MVLNNYDISLWYATTKECKIKSLFSKAAFNPIQNLAGKKAPIPVFPCNFYRRRDDARKRFDFYLQPFCYTGVRGQGHI